MEKVKTNNQQVNCICLLEKIIDLQNKMLKSDSDFRNKQSLLAGKFRNDLNNFSTSILDIFEPKTVEEKKSYINSIESTEFLNSFRNNTNSNEDQSYSCQSSNIFLSKKISRMDEEDKTHNENIINTAIINTKKPENKIFSICKLKKDNSRGKSHIYRGSKYRGVTKNGKTWQVLIMINRCKKYFGKFNSEESAAKAYDELAMKFHGGKARLNFPHEGFVVYKNENKS